MKILDEAKSAGTSLHTATRRAEELQEQMTAGLMEMNGILDGLYDAIIANVRSRVDAGVSGDDAPNGDNILERWAFLDGLFDAMAGAELSVWQGRDKSGEEAAAFFADIGTVMRESGDGLAAFLASGVVTDPGVVDQYNILSGQLSRFSGLLAEFSAEWARGESFSAALAASTDNLLNLFDELDVETSGLAVGSVENANARTTDVEAIVSSSILTSLVILVASTVAGVILALFITRGIVNPINAVIRSLSQSEAVIEAAAGKIDVASHDLSEGVTSQAAAIEETASALEEVSAMSRASAANAGNTKGSAEKASRLVREGSGDMTEMSAAMQKINQQADRISNIIKTIEEIAFQTNLLALNAAVEAARAGEAGKGFAVVADEVRNLSGRSAQAAKDTAELITATVESVRSGSTILERLSGGYGEIETSIGGIQSLIEQIASASDEQSQGVEQINTAIAQMNKVTQQNASGAEASAASAEDLEKQVADLRVNVGVLQAIVAGKKGRSAGSAKHALPRGNGRKALPLPAPSSSRGSAGGVVVMRPDMVLDEEV